MRVRTCRRGLLMSCAGTPTLYQAMRKTVSDAEAPFSVTQQVLPHGRMLCTLWPARHWACNVTASPTVALPALYICVCGETRSAMSIVSICR